MSQHYRAVPSRCFQTFEGSIVVDEICEMFYHSDFHWTGSHCWRCSLGIHECCAFHLLLVFGFLEIRSVSNVAGVVTYQYVYACTVDNLYNVCTIVFMEDWWECWRPAEGELQYDDRRSDNLFLHCPKVVRMLFDLHYYESDVPSSLWPPFKENNLSELWQRVALFKFYFFSIFH